MKRYCFTLKLLSEKLPFLIILSLAFFNEPVNNFRFDIWRLSQLFIRENCIICSISHIHAYLCKVRTFARDHSLKEYTH
jgi:hypothetical protein